MEFEVLPGPPLPELARTTMARAFAATVCFDGAVTTVPVRADRAGRPVLLPGDESALARELAAMPSVVTVTVPANAPFSSLRITGLAHAAAPGAYPVTPHSMGFAGPNPAPVAAADYGAAAPDPFWREAPAILRHLDACHESELIACVRSHGLTSAECIVPRGLDRFGLELLVFTDAGLVSARLAYPDGPVNSLREIPVSIRTVLTCRCGRSTGPGTRT
jgi:hypothetical protein